MEEIAGAEAIQGEILGDARKKAARLLEEADEESASTVAAIEGRALAVVEEVVRSSEARAARFRMETMARFPLERTRMRTAFVERALRGALEAYMRSLSEDRVAALSEAMLAKGASFLSGKDLVVSRKGVSEAAARRIASRALSGASALAVEEDDSMTGIGLVARARDGSVVLRATMDLVEERLLDERRGELARALCAEALEA